MPLPETIEKLFLPDDQVDATTLNAMQHGIVASEQQAGLDGPGLHLDPVALQAPTQVVDADVEKLMAVRDDDTIAPRVALEPDRRIGGAHRGESGVGPAIGVHQAVATERSVVDLLAEVASVGEPAAVVAGELTA